MKLNTILIMATIAFTGSFSFAEIKPDGSILEVACANNENHQSDIVKLCQAEITGLKDTFYVTHDLQQVSRVWKVTTSDVTSQIGKGGTVITLQSIQQVGFSINGFFQPADSVQSNLGRLMETAGKETRSLTVVGSFNGQPVIAKDFSYFFFTL